MTILLSMFLQKTYDDMGQKVLTHNIYICMLYIRKVITHNDTNVVYIYIYIYIYIYCIYMYMMVVGRKFL